MIDFYYMIYMLPALILSMICQAAVSSTFKKYSGVRNSKGITGKDAAETVLRMGVDGESVDGVAVTSVSGSLTDHFDPRSCQIRLSEPVYDKASISAVGVAAHEAGHAVQHASGYAMIKLRTALVPVCNLGARMSPLLIVMGLIFTIPPLHKVGVLLFCTVALFQLVTLPVEFNASKRALIAIEQSGILSDEELKGAKKVLTAAAMTYVAALFTSLMQIFYYVNLGNRNNRR